MSEPQTAAEVLAKVEAEHGIEAARVAARFMVKEDLPWKFRHNARDAKVAGKRAKPWRGIPRTGSSEPDRRERGNMIGPLPRSGAPRPPRRAPRDIEGGAA